MIPKKCVKITGDSVPQIPVDWDERERVAKEVFEDAEHQFIFLRFIEGIACGEKTRTMTDELKILWSDFVSLYAYDRRCYDLYLMSRRKGDEYRQALREDEADRRAVEGTLRPVFHKGNICGHVREYSDSLLAIQLKAGNPDRYADRQKVEHRGVMLNLNVEGVVRDAAT